MKLDFININYFIISFFVGMLFVYMIEPQPEVIIKYPVPNSTFVYKDESDMCYKYDYKEVSCNNSAIEFPIQNLRDINKNRKSIIQGINDKIFKR
jgi:hypothetical protein